MICETKDCGQTAVVVPKLCVPAVGVPIDLQRPVSLIINLPLCDKCAGELVLKDWLSDDLKRIIEIGFQGKGLPDFARAFFTQVSIGSTEHDLFRRAREQAS